MTYSASQPPSKKTGQRRDLLGWMRPFGARSRFIALLIITAVTLFATNPTLQLSAAVLPPTLTKTFDGLTFPTIDYIHANQISVLKFVINNRNGTALTAGTTTNSAHPPSMWCPSIRHSAQNCSEPPAHHWQRPHVTL